MSWTEITSLSAIEHVARNRPERIQRLFLPKNQLNKNPRVGEIYSIARSLHIPVDMAYLPKDREEPAKAILHPFEYTKWEDFLAEATPVTRGAVLALDHLQDPQNLGALCRTAEAFGLLGILVPKDRGVLVGPGVYHASVGAVETIPIVPVTNLGESLRRMKDAGYWIVGAAHGQGARSPEETPDFEKKVIVLGSEWEGLSPTLQKTCDWLIEIPMRGKVESLNVSVAGAILMYTLVKC